MGRVCRRPDPEDAPVHRSRRRRGRGLPGLVRRGAPDSARPNGTRLPPADGLLRLTDGTVARVKGGLPDFAGDAISGELETGGVRVAYAARGLFAARAENGELSAVCGGEVTCVEGGGLSLQLDAPVDLALVKINGEWRGVWQTPDTDAPVPQTLRRITRRWTKLRAVKSLPK